MAKRAGGWTAEEAMEVIANVKTDMDTDARRGVIGYCVSRIKHGPMMDLKVYPIWNTRGAKVEAERVRRQSTAAQKNVNLRRSMDEVVYLANENFEEGDVLLTLTAFKVDGDDEMSMQKDAKRVLRNYIDKLRREWAKRERELKYIYSMEYTDTVAFGRRYHVHILLNAHGFERDWLEGLWTKSACNTERYQHQDEYMSGFAGYLKKPKPEDGAKGEQKKACKRAWAASKNLKRPQPVKSRTKISIRKMERISRALEAEARQIIEQVYPEYRCTRDVVTKRSEFVPGVYMYARMRVREESEKQNKTGAARWRRE